MEKKKWYQSKTIWGIIIAALGVFITEYVGVSDIVLPENADFNQLKAYAEAIKAAQGNYAEIFGQIISSIGGILAIIGRINADQKIG
jgi:hypothetical protein